MLKLNRFLVIEIISCLFILLFVYAGTSKLLDFQKFNNQIGQSPILSPISNLVVVGIPGLEYFFSILLLMKKWRLVSLYGSFGLMVAFSAYIVVVTNFSDFIPCSCGGILEKMSWNQHLTFNLGFLILAIVGILLYPVSINKQI